MIPRTAHKMLTVVVAVGALIFATACDNPIDPDAAKVDGVGISRDALFEEVEAFANLPDEMVGLQTDSQNAYAAGGVANVLSTMIADRIYQTTAERAGIEVTADDIENARRELSESSALRQPLDSLPSDLVDRLVERAALRSVVDQYVSTRQWWNDDDVARFHDATKSRACVRHIVVASEDEANAIIDELEAGADFEQLARERSADAGTAQDGGALGCNPRGYFVEALDDAIEGAADGELVGPLSFAPAGTPSWHVIRVDEAYRVRSLEETRASIEELFSAPNGWAEYVLRTTDVDVDPRFGTWDATSAAVIPPAGAQPRS